MEIYQEILIVPQAQPRHRLSRKGRNFRMYDPAQEDKARLRRAVLHSVEIDRPLKGAIRLRIDFVMPRPYSHYGTGRNVNRLKPTAPFWHTSKPDVDNMYKFVTDALNGLLWEDDKTICSMASTKRYGELPRIIIEAEEINQRKQNDKD